jgi:hypothetical protein
LSKGKVREITLNPSKWIDENFFGLVATIFFQAISKKIYLTLKKLLESHKKRNRYIIDLNSQACDRMISDGGGILLFM